MFFFLIIRMKILLIEIVLKNDALPLMPTKISTLSFVIILFQNIYYHEKNLTHKNNNNNDNN